MRRTNFTSFRTGTLTQQGVNSSSPVPPGADLCLESEHGCEHICESSPGSFHCLCLPGYTLNPDGKTCAGERLVTAVSGTRTTVPQFRPIFPVLKECDCSLHKGGKRFQICYLNKRSQEVLKCSEVRSTKNIFDIHETIHQLIKL